MKKLIILFCALAALVTGLCGCQQKVEEPMKIVDLRYRAQDSYDLAATGAKPFTILVVTSKSSVSRKLYAMVRKFTAI